jgi:hypothetical protein
MKKPAPTNPRAFAAGILGALFLILGIATPAQGIPAFARKYKVSCTLCHSPFPRLTAFGLQFASNGFEFAPGEPARDTVNTGDPLLRLQNSLPLAIRMEGYLNALTQEGENVAAFDLQTPWGIKLLTGGQVTDGVSYYMYFFMSERGEIAGLEDAYVQFTDVGGSGINLIAGQFQVADPLFKRELRLEYDDYHLFRARVGEVQSDLTYDRGLFANFSPWENGDVNVMLVNGRGLSQAEDNGLFDTDKLKNVMVHYGHTLGGATVGMFGYLGQERKEGTLDQSWVWGPLISLPLGTRVELNAQYLHRQDNNPFYLENCVPGDPRCDPSAEDPLEVNLDGFMTELLFFPQGAAGRWVLSGLYNFVKTDREALSLRLGEEGYLSRYQTVAAGATYLLRRNLRAMGEVGYDTELERARFIFGVVTAF